MKVENGTLILLTHDCEHINARIMNTALEALEDEMFVHGLLKGVEISKEDIKDINTVETPESEIKLRDILQQIIEEIKSR